MLRSLFVFGIFFTLCLSETQASPPVRAHAVLESGNYGANWEVLDPVYSGHNTYLNWKYDIHGQVVSEFLDYSWSTIRPASATNDTIEDRAPVMTSDGTITIKLHWIGTGARPSSVWIKVQSRASYGYVNEIGGEPPLSGSADEGFGDPVYPCQSGFESAGFEYFLATVDSNGIATKTITLSAWGSYSAPWAEVSAGCFALAATPDPLLFAPDQVTFDNALTDIIDQNTTFGSEQGSPYPVRGWRKLGENNPEAFPVLMKRDTSLNLSFRHKFKIDWAEPTNPVGYKLEAWMSATGYWFSWPEQSGTASDDSQSKSFVSDQRLHDQVHKLTYGPAWRATPDQPWSALSYDTGSSDIYVTWDSPIGEVVTKKRIDWAVTAADGTTTIEEVADGIWQALGGSPPYDPGTPGKRILPDGYSEWQLLDQASLYYGECDEQARLMRRGIRLLGVDGSVQLVRASSNTENVLDLEFHDSEWQSGLKDYLIYYYPSPNAFEGCCVVPVGEGSERWYAVWPQIKCTSALDILRALIAGGAEQWWVTMEGYHVPGEDNNWTRHILHKVRIQELPQ